MASLKGKRLLLLLALIFGVPVFLILTCRFTGIYGFYTIPTSNMYPAITAGEMIFTSNLPDFDKGDIIVYRGPNDLQNPGAGEVDLVCRLVAVAGEQVELKQGLLYINNKLADDTMNIGFFFRVATDDANRVAINAAGEMVFPSMNADTIILNATYKDVSRFITNGKNAHRMTSDYRVIDPSLFNCKADTFWSAENFGPVLIPKDHVFLMGDNRVNSLDSRYRGFIPCTKLVAEVLNGKQSN